ncbi:MAG: M55 family metallopeptidase [Anaerolineae bacterium]|nr:M55 family metallopeptidase [Anaerolineae bacterium]
MKVLIAADMEGLAGLVQWDSSEEELMRRLMTEEVNAAARGAFAGGATEVLAAQSHGGMRNLLPEALDPRVTYMAGQPKPLNHMAGVDGSFDLALFVGYHSRAGTRHGVMAHTFSNGVFSLSFNGIEMGEIGTDAALCGHFGVPVGLVCGDQAACEEATALLGDVITVPVKEGVSRFAARCLPLAAARSRIERSAADAVRHAGSFAPFVVAGPIAVSLTFTLPEFADAVEHLDFVSRVDGRTVTFEAEDFPRAFERFNALHFLAPTVR